MLGSSVRPLQLTPHARTPPSLQLLLCLSICLLSRSADRLFYTLLLMVVLDKKADLEEQAIVHEHPEYARYLLQVPKFVPNLGALVGRTPTPHLDAAGAAADDDAGAPLLHGAARSTTSLPPAERERLERLAADGAGARRVGSHPGRLMDAH